MINGRFFSYLNTAEQIINSYNGTSPFSEFIKSFFRSNKKAGSKDRKWIASLCYAYFRIGRAALQISVREQVVTGFYLCSTEKNEFLEAVEPEWNATVASSVNTKLSIIRQRIPGFSLENIFPFPDHISSGIDHKAFVLALLRQPDIFIRIRPGHVNSVHRKLKRADINFTALDEYAIKIPTGTDLEKIMDLQSELVIQDYSSQKTADYFPKPEEFNGPVRIWDCCAASGGKSILANDQYKNVQLTVSDNRESVLKNLEVRFEDAGIENYLSYIVDLSKLVPDGVRASEIPKDYFDLIITDVPCSGSGTWARTPERMRFIKEDDLQQYSSLQFSIVSNTIPYLKRNGFLLYITCSVYKEENEEVVERLVHQHQLKMIKSGIISGTAFGADTLFAALLTS
ncbi:Fmu (Sun) domain-containing protein [Pollutibacter soli]|uniref:Fmu (Sun) domain-containing protein n=1 Tax=Pollutibacter soli TaxID=3034157 RepID=UPI003013FC64